jgi:hypothetical protein
LDQQSGHCGIDSAAQTADYASVTDLVIDFLSRFIEKRRHRPISGASADSGREVFEDVDPSFCVSYFRMEQQPIAFSRLILNGGDRGVGAGANYSKPLWGLGDEVSVTGPNSHRVWQ